MAPRGLLFGGKMKDIGRKRRGIGAIIPMPCPTTTNSKHQWSLSETISYLFFFPDRRVCEHTCSSRAQWADVISVPVSISVHILRWDNTCLNILCDECVNSDLNKLCEIVFIMLSCSHCSLWGVNPWLSALTSAFFLEYHVCVPNAKIIHNPRLI